MGFFWKNKRLASFRLSIAGFAGVILVGSLLLMLPIASRAGEATAFLDALFTATSAVCVTGLVVFDTANYWSGFGQAVILLLIQIGGMGVVTVAGAIAIMSGRRIGLFQRSAMQDAISAHKLGGVVRLTWFVLRVAVVIELLGAVVMYPVFLQDFGAGKGLWYALFHSVSAFCNAGFDLMGVYEPFSSLMHYRENVAVNVTVMLLIVVGGIGFLTWDDVRAHGPHLNKYTMQSKVILLTTTLLILLPAAYFFFGEFADHPMHRRILLSFFQSVTPRTAGFNTADLNAMSETGQSVLTALMLIGGSPGSTAGGMKTTTLAVLVACAAAVFQRRESAHLFGRRVSDDAVRSASVVLLMYLSLFLTGGLAISRMEGLPVLDCLFEAASAIGTVGLSLGITPGLSAVSRLILVALMFFGRVGGLTLVFAAVSSRQGNIARLPQERITVG